MALSPVHPGVLGGATLVVSPALWLSLVAGALPLQDALVKFLIAVCLSWLALNVLATWFLPAQTADGSGRPSELSGPDGRAPLVQPSSGTEAG